MGHNHGPNCAHNHRQDRPIDKSGDVELNNMPSSSSRTDETEKDGHVDSPQTPCPPDIMDLARKGDVPAIQQHIKDKIVTVTHTDRHGTTLLHWAAINDQYVTCHFLITAGADVNAKGGDANATPALWATSRNAYYIIDLLLKNGADPLVADSQGYNLLHSAALNGYEYLLLTLLHRGAPIDCKDGQGQTALMWAAYRGHSTCADILLRWGASPDQQDGNGFTALHWAVVSGNLYMAEKLMEHGVNRFIKSVDGKTPADVAKDSNVLLGWHISLDRAGFRLDGSRRVCPIPFVRDESTFYRRFVLVWPFFILLIVFSAFAHMPIYASIPTAGFSTFIMQFILKKILSQAPPNVRESNQVPLLAGFFSTCFCLVMLRFFTHIVPITIYSNPFLTLIVCVLSGMASFFYYRAMTDTPGYIPIAKSRSDQKAVVEQLLSEFKFDPQHFCTICMARRALRSKHCRTCGRCVSKHDHHCPWIDNCVGSGNLRAFLLFLTSLLFALSSLIYLTVEYANALPEMSSDLSRPCLLVSDELCTSINKDRFTIVLNFTLIANTIWVLMLVSVQLLQVARGITTWENMRGFYHRSTAGTVEEIFGPMPAGMASSSPYSGSGQPPSGPRDNDQLPPRAIKPKPSRFDSVKKLFGLDVFIHTAAQTADAEYNARKRSNPYGQGLVTNCSDVWFEPGNIFSCDRTTTRNDDGGTKSWKLNLLGGTVIDYANFYDIPAIRRPFGTRGSSGYEPVGTDENV